MDENTHSISQILKKVIQSNKLEYGLNKVGAKDAWRTVMGEPIWKYTTAVELQGSTLYVQLSSAPLREELSYGKDKIMKLINEEMRAEIVKKVVLG